MTASYCNKTKIGNYFEDQEADRIKVQDFLNKLHTGNLTFIKQEQKLKALTQSVDPVHKHKDFVSFQDIVQISPAANPDKSLAVVLDDIAIPNSISATVTVSSLSTSTVRNSFFIVRDEIAMNQYIADFDDRFEPNDTVLRYGQKFHFVANPEVCDHQLALYSEPKSFRAFSRVTNKQIFCAHAPRKVYSSFVVVHPNPELRLEMEGEPVPRESPVLIVHSQSGGALDFGSATVATDFGPELETFCSRVGSAQKWIIS
ncbi:hypothetical protein GEMRC1_012809 [Eukaryota sp. GEM-RC1]